MYNGSPGAQAAGNRAYQELERLANGKRLTRFAREIGIKTPSPSHWKSGLAPSWLSLNRLYYAGADIIYIVTGERRDEAQSI